MPPKQGKSGGRNNKNNNKKNSNKAAEKKQGGGEGVAPAAAAADNQPKPAAAGGEQKKNNKNEKQQQDKKNNNGNKKDQQKKQDGEPKAEGGGKNKNKNRNRNKNKNKNKSEGNKDGDKKKPTKHADPLGLNEIVADVEGASSPSSPEATKAAAGDASTPNKSKNNRRRGGNRPAGMTKAQYREQQIQKKNSSAQGNHPGGGSPIFISPGGTKHHKGSHHLTREELLAAGDDDDEEGGGRGGYREDDEDVRGSSCDENDEDDEDRGSGGGGGSDSGEDYSDTQNERKREYRKGGYHPVMIGDLYNERYRIVDKLGWGHFSTVWLVHDYENQTFQAMKVQKSASHYREAALDEIKLLSEIMEGAREYAERHHEHGVTLADSHCASMTDYFEHVGPNGVHVCMIFDLLGENLLALIERYQYRGIPIPIVKSIAQQTLRGLEHLHSLSILHTDLKPENVLLSCPKHKVISKMRRYTPPAKHERNRLLDRDVSTMTKSQKRRYYDKLRKEKKKEDDEGAAAGGGKKAAADADKKSSNAAGDDAAAAAAEEAEAPERPSAKASPSHSPMKHKDANDEDSETDQDWEIERYHNVTLADFGNSCWVDKQFTDEVQTRQYRCPEVILGDGYSTPIDLWSAACMFFELITGEFLFDPKQNGDFSRDEDHLALMMELLGDLPDHMAMGHGKYRAEFLDSNGQLRHIEELKYWSLRDVLCEKYRFTKKKASEIAGFLLPMLALDPKERATATEMLTHFQSFFDVAEDDYAPRCYTQEGDEESDDESFDDDDDDDYGSDEESFDEEDSESSGYEDEDTEDALYEQQDDETSSQYEARLLKIREKNSKQTSRRSHQRKPKKHYRHHASEGPGASELTLEQLREGWKNHPLLNEQALEMLGLTIEDVQLTLAGKSLDDEDKEMAAAVLLEKLSTDINDAEGDVLSPQAADDDDGSSTNSA